MTIKMAANTRVVQTKENDLTKKLIYCMIFNRHYHSDMHILPIIKYCKGLVFVGVNVYD